MVNLRAIANRATSGINPNTAATVRVYTGSTTDRAGHRVPVYASPAPLTIQTQSLGKREIEHLDSLNLAPAERAVYANLQLTSVDRVKQSGGDLLQFEGAVWLVTAILEGWTTAGWCKVAVTRQQGEVVV